MAVSRLPSSEQTNAFNGLTTRKDLTIHEVYALEDSVVRWAESYYPTPYHAIKCVIQFGTMAYIPTRSDLDLAIKRASIHIVDNFGRIVDSSAEFDGEAPPGAENPIGDNALSALKMMKAGQNAIWAEMPKGVPPGYKRAVYLEYMRPFYSDQLESFLFHLPIRVKNKARLNSMYQPRMWGATFGTIIAHRWGVCPISRLLRHIANEILKDNFTLEGWAVTKMMEENMNPTNLEAIRKSLGSGEYFRHGHELVGLLLNGGIRVTEEARRLLLADMSVAEP